VGVALNDLGFSAAEERVYRALLADPGVDIETLAAQSACSPDDVTEIVRQLIEFAVVKPDGTSPTGVAVQNPSMALGELIEFREDELMGTFRRIASTRSELAALDAEFTAPARNTLDEQGVERLDNLDSVRERLDELSFFSRKSVYSIQPGGPQTKEALDASRPLDLRSLRRKIDMRIIHETSRLDDELNRAYLRELVMLGAHIRVTSGRIERMIIMDEELAFVPLDPQNPSRGALVVRHPGLLSGFLDLFNRSWQDAQELPWSGEGVEQPEAVEMSENDRRVLALLASGCTDETAAREIGVSVRHLRRRISRLMQELGATSRFEAGVEAARRGWL